MQSFTGLSLPQRDNFEFAQRLSSFMIWPSIFVFAAVSLLFYVLSHINQPILLLVTGLSVLGLSAYVVIYRYVISFMRARYFSVNPTASEPDNMIDGFMVLLLCFSLLHALGYLFLGDAALSIGLLLLILLVAGVLVRETHSLILFMFCAVVPAIFLIQMEKFVPLRSPMMGLLFISAVVSVALHILQRNFERELQHLSHSATVNQDSLLTTVRRSEERFKRLADATFEGVVFHDQGIILDANRRFAEMFDYDVEELRGKKLLDLIAPRARDVMQGHLERNTGTSVSQLSMVKDKDQLPYELEQSSDSYESLGWTNQEKIFPIDILERPLPLNDRVITVASVRDMTQVKENEGKMRSYEEELEQRNVELLRANKLKTSFLANMSHELRTPLTAINGFAELLKGEYFGKLNEKQTQYVDDIYESGLHLLELINGILDLSKVEADKMTLRLQHTDLSAMVQEAFKIVQAKAEAKGIALSVDSESDTVLLIDPVRIRQVLYNYLSNAVKFTPQGGDVVVRIFDTEHAIMTEVKDTGIGISHNDQLKLFEPFMQVDNSTTRNQEGTGLGLALTRKLVHLHGGDVWVRSEEGKGSVFGFSIPRSLALMEAMHTDSETQITIPSTGSIHDLTETLPERNEQDTGVGSVAPISSDT